MNYDPENNTNKPVYDVKDESYFVTISLHPDLYNKSARIQLKKTMGKLFEYIKGFSNDFILMAELTKKGNLHYHAIIKFNQIEFAGEQLTESLRNVKEFGNTLVNEQIIKEKTRTLEYLMKDYNKTNTIINKIKYGKPGYTVIYPVYKIYNPKLNIPDQIIYDTSELDKGIDIEEFIQMFTPLWN